MPDDHDLLITMNANLATLIGAVADMAKRYEEMNTRLVILERKDSGDSEKFRNMTAQIQNSLDNAGKITALTSDVDNLGEKIRDLQKKSYILDGINALGIIIAAIYFKVTGGNP